MPMFRVLDEFWVAGACNAPPRLSRGHDQLSKWVLGQFCFQLCVAAFCVLLATCESTRPASAMACAHDVLGIDDSEDLGCCEAACLAAAAIALLCLVPACGCTAAAMCRAFVKLTLRSLNEKVHLSCELVLAVEKRGVSSLESWRFHRAFGACCA